MFQMLSLRRNPQKKFRKKLPKMLLLNKRMKLRKRKSLWRKSMLKNLLRNLLTRLNNLYLRSKLKQKSKNNLNPNKRKKNLSLMKKQNLPQVLSTLRNNLSILRNKISPAI